MLSKEQDDSTDEKQLIEDKAPVPRSDSNPAPSITASSKSEASREATLKDAVKPKHKRKKRGSASIDGS